MAAGLKVGRPYRLRKVDRGGPVDPNASGSQRVGKLVEQFVALFDRLCRPHAVLAAHVGVFRNLGVQCRLRRRNVAAGRYTDNYVLERVPFVPAAYAYWFR